MTARLSFKSANLDGMTSCRNPKCVLDFSFVRRTLIFVICTCSPVDNDFRLPKFRLERITSPTYYYNLQNNEVTRRSTVPANIALCNNSLAEI